MAKFSAIYKITNSQAELDFVDIDTSTDTPLYVDPYAIQIRNDEWSDACSDDIKSFFNAVLDALRSKNITRAKHLLSHLHEPNETFLGQSQGNPQGKGFGKNKINKLIDALIKSKAFKSGVLSDISEAELFIRDIGPDMISDLTTNILRGKLAQYTKNQCELHNVSIHNVNSLGPIWDPVALNWVAKPLELPIHLRKPILLVPKFSVRMRLSLDSQEFWNHYMIEFLRAEYHQSGSGLIHMFKDGRTTVYKKPVKEKHPFVKDNLAQFVTEHPEILEQYKKIKGAKGTLEISDLVRNFDEPTFAQILADRLTSIPSGNDHASEYHSVIMGIITFLFYPGLINPIKEKEIHSGRKRIDIKYSNTGENRFFKGMLNSPQTRALSVAVECKNYSKDVTNPEIDQLAGRFGPTRGKLGFLLCRSVEKRRKLIERCKDTASDDRGFILIFEDADILKLLNIVKEGKRPELENYLFSRFDEIAD